MKAVRKRHALHIESSFLRSRDAIGPRNGETVKKHQRHWFDDDERFRHAYAVLDDCPEVWPDKKGNYKGPSRPSE